MPRIGNRSLTVLALLFAGLFAGAHADLEKDLQELKAHYLPAEYANTNFTLDDAKRLFLKKCQKAGVTDTEILTQIKNATKQFTTCLDDIANITQILDEIEVARPRGELDDVFNKYCRRQPQAEQCLTDFNNAILPCLTRAERAQNAILLRIITRLLSFICYKDGDQIAMFIAEEGPECLQANKENISNCMNATFAGYLPKNGSLLGIQDLPEMLMTSKQCIDLNDFEECVLGYLEQCNEITPANIIESMFRYVKNETKCQPEIEKVQQKRLQETRNASPATLLAGSGFNSLLTFTSAAIAIVLLQKLEWL